MSNDTNTALNKYKFICKHQEDNINFLRGLVDEKDKTIADLNSDRLHMQQLADARRGRIMEMNKDMDELNVRYDDAMVEIERLRAENEGLRQRMLEARRVLDI